MFHPNIPKPLHGTVPREIRGKSWWNKVRKAAYAEGDFKCWVCGVSKHFARYHRWLEGHESYDIDYEKGTVKLKEIVALCHSCHNFIHDGRMQILVEKGEMSADKYIEVIKHGTRFMFAYLERFHANVWTGKKWKLLYEPTYPFQIRFPDISIRGLRSYDEDEMAEWGDWRLILDGEEYQGFKTEADYIKAFSL